MTLSRPNSEKATLLTEVKQMLWYWRRIRKGLAICLLCVGIFLSVFALYHIPAAAVLYPGILCTAALLALGAADAVREKRKLKDLSALKSLPEDLPDRLEAYDGDVDTAYREIIQALSEKYSGLLKSVTEQEKERSDYNLTWVHQIKTPIASMRLLLEGEDSDFGRSMGSELQRIEQYVEMVLTYQRLNSVDTDYVFRRCSLDKLVKESIRKFAGSFICKGIRLEYIPIEESPVTDEKWLAFVVEQVLSNAVKYTNCGFVRIFWEEDSLCIQDTGIGIVAEDLPRIFKRGYTGNMGRSDKKASGLGLYLCRRICDNLGHGICIESTPGEGTTVKIRFRRGDSIYE